MSLDAFRNMTFQRETILDMETFMETVQTLVLNPPRRYSMMYIHLHTVL